MNELPPQLRNDAFRFLFLNEMGSRDAKSPARGEGAEISKHTWQEAEEELRRGHNVGIIAGHDRLRLIDLDIYKCKDKEKASKLEAQMRDILHTFTVRTGSGGLHFYVLSDYAVNGDFDDALGEMRCFNQYVAVPGSVNAEGRMYSIEDNLPIAEKSEALLEQLAMELGAKTTPDIELADAPKRPLYVIPDSLNALLRDGADINTGNLIFWQVVKDLHLAGVPADEVMWMLLDFNSKCRPPQLEERVKYKVKYLLANADRYLVDKVDAKWLMSQGMGDADVPTAELVVVEDGELDALELPKIDWLVDGILPSKGLTVLAARAKSYKTYMALRMCAAIARGEDFFGLKTKASKVLYFDGEIGPTAFRERKNRIRDGMGAASLEGLCGVFPLMNGNKIARLDTAAGLKQIEATIVKHKPALVVFDVFRRFVKVKEDKADEINSLYTDTLLPLVERQNIAILMVFHNRKPGKEQIKVSPFEVDALDALDEVRGSSELVNIADSILLIKRFGKKSPFFAFFAVPRNAEQKDMFFRLDFDDYARTATFCQVTPDDIETAKEIEDNSKLETVLEWVKDKAEFTTGQFKKSVVPALKNEQADRLLERLMDDGIIRRKGRGVYIVTTVTNSTLQDIGSHISHDSHIVT